MSMREPRHGGLTALCWFEQFDGIAVRVFNLHLTATRTDLHLVTERYARVLEAGNTCGQVVHLQDDPVPSTWLLGLPIWHLPRSRRSRPAQEEVRPSQRDIRERGQLL